MTVLLPPTRHLDIVWQAGDDTPAVIPVPDHEGVELDVTGWSATAVVVADGAEVHRWSTGDGSAVCGPGGVSLLADDSDSWTWYRGRFEVHVLAPDGTQRVPARGDMFVEALRFAPAAPPPPPTPPVPAGTLVMRHGDSWRPRKEQPSSPRFALHSGGVALALEDWWVRAQARQEGASRPLFAWRAHLSAVTGTGVEIDTARYRRPGPPDPSKPALVELPAMWMRLDVADWEDKPREWEGLFEVELTRGSLSAPLERMTLAARPLIVVPDLIP